MYIENNPSKSKCPFYLSRCLIRWTFKIQHPFEPCFLPFNSSRGRHKPCLPFMRGVTNTDDIFPWPRSGSEFPALRPEISGESMMHSGVRGKNRSDSIQHNFLVLRTSTYCPKLRKGSHPERSAGKHWLKTTNMFRSANNLLENPEKIYNRLINGDSQYGLWSIMTIP